jgi:phosphohistidine phosphatase
MKILLVRHAKAEDCVTHAATGGSDDTRPLTGSGGQTARQLGRALKQLQPRVDLIAASPYARALETAQHIAHAYKRLKVTPLPALQPGAMPRAILAWLHAQPEDAAIILVGHEPVLSEFASWLLSGDARPMLAFKKAGACLIAFDGPPGPGRGQLEWFAPPRQLRCYR